MRLTISPEKTRSTVEVSELAIRPVVFGDIEPLR